MRGCSARPKLLSYISVGNNNKVASRTFIKSTHTTVNLVISGQSGPEYAYLALPEFRHGKIEMSFLRLLNG